MDAKLLQLACNGINTVLILDSICIFQLYSINGYAHLLCCHKSLKIGK